MVVLKLQQPPTQQTGVHAKAFPSNIFPVGKKPLMDDFKTADFYGWAAASKRDLRGRVDRDAELTHSRMAETAKRALEKVSNNEMPTKEEAETLRRFAQTCSLGHSSRPPHWKGESGAIERIEAVAAVVSGLFRLSAPPE